MFYVCILHFCAYLSKFESEDEYSFITLFPGSVVIAAITSCTNTSNPSVMLGAGLLAKRAVELGLSVEPYIKTSLSPGSGVVTYYLQESGVIPSLEKLGYDLFPSYLMTDPLYIRREWDSVYLLPTKLRVPQSLWSFWAQQLASTVKPRLTTTLLIQPPCYYERKAIHTTAVH